MKNEIKDSTIIAFDIHKVLLRPNIWKMLILVIKEFSISSFKLLLNLSFWKHLFSEGAVSENIIDDICKKNNDKITKTFLIHLLNKQILNKEMILLLQSLKEQGYRLFVASNIWDSLLNDLRKKYPILDTLFEGYFIPSKINYIEKPDPRFYDGFEAYLLKKGLWITMIIFVDDKYRNIKSARKEGIVAIKYETVPKLKNKLKDLGIVC